MKKYIFTESQVKTLVNNIIECNDVLLENQEVYNLEGLAEILSRTGRDEITLFDILKDLYRHGGDEAIIKTFKESTGIDIKDVGKGRYVFNLR